MHVIEVRPTRAQPAWADRGGHKNPPSAPPAIPPIIITPFNKQIPNPAIDPRSKPPGPPIVPPRRPDLRMCAAFRCIYQWNRACPERRNFL